MLKPLPLLPETIEQFHRRIEREFCQGSAIDPILFAATVQVRSDLEVDETGEPVTPFMMG